MSIFGKIRDAIFGKARAATPVREPAGAGAPVERRGLPDEISEVDVEQQLDAKPGADKLNWRTSIVDLMKLIGVESSYDNRKQLAEELGNASYEGSAEDNIRLHRQTMQELARNGGKVPREFLD